MDAYVFNAEILCSDHGIEAMQKIISEKLKEAFPFLNPFVGADSVSPKVANATSDQLEHAAEILIPNYMTRNDSNIFPQGPYADGGGEADTPQHCAKCGMFLENPLTSDGRAYVQDAIDNREGDEAILKEWGDFYGIEPTKDICEKCGGTGLQNGGDKCAQCVNGWIVR